MSPRFPPRNWHQRALKAWSQQRPQDFLVVACVGSGKTDFALQWAEQRLKDREAERLVVVCPTEYLRRQWQTQAMAFGIQLVRYRNDHEPEASDFHGSVLTYAQLNERWVARHRAFCRRPTAVVFDEIHHAGDDLTWGAKLREAFDPASYRLALSGTPWRGDQSRIPFVRYVDGQSEADFSYSYGAALKDGIVRHVFFPNVEGRMEWWTAHGGPAVATFSDELSSDEVNRRLRTALLPSGDVVRTLIQQGHGRLQQLRDEHSDAAGLVICIDREHAAAVADVVARVTGTRPALVLSDPDEMATAAEDPHAEIQRFRTDDRQWLVAVRMVSEGVDIPRLRVLVYATNVADSELAFRQAVGRVVRMVPGLDEQSAHVFMPADARLITYAQALAQERNHSLDDVMTEDVTHDGRAPTQQTMFVPIDATQARLDGEVASGERFPESELRRADEMMATANVRIPRVTAAQLLRVALGAATTAGKARTEAASITEIPLEQQKANASKVLNTLTTALAYSTGHGDQVQFFNGLFVRVLGRKRPQWSLREIQLATDLCRRWQQEVTAGVNRSDSDWMEAAYHAWRSSATA